MSFWRRPRPKSQSSGRAARGLMRSPGERSIRRTVAAILIALLLPVGGTWLAVKITTDHLLYEEATSAARNWARHLAASINDLEQIAAGEQPSAASMVFF